MLWVILWKFWGESLAPFSLVILLWLKTIDWYLFFMLSRSISFLFSWAIFFLLLSNLLSGRYCLNFSLTISLLLDLERPSNLASLISANSGEYDSLSSLMLRANMVLSWFVRLDIDESDDVFCVLMFSSCTLSGEVRRSRLRSWRNEWIFLHPLGDDVVV